MILVNSAERNFNGAQKITLSIPMRSTGYQHRHYCQIYGVSLNIHLIRLSMGRVRKYKKVKCRSAFF